MRIADICTRDAIHVDPGLSVRDAAKLMRGKHIGTLLVAERQGERTLPAGIVTDRDIVVAVIAADVEAGSLTVGDIMSTDPVTCREDQDLFDAVEMMCANGIRRLPVLDRDGALCGLLSADDVVSALGTHLHELARAMTRGQAHESRARP